MNFIQKLLCVSMAMLISSCTLHNVEEQYEPLVPVDAVYSLNQDGTRLTEHWYKSFADAALDSLIEEALLNNFDLAEAWSRLAQLALSRDITGAAALPQVNASLSPAGQDSDSLGWSDSTAASVSLAWELDLWGKIRSERNADESAYRAGELDLQNTALLLSRSITSQYFDWLEQRERIELLKKQLNVNQSLYELTSLRVLSGQVSIVDVQQQKQRVLNSESELAFSDSRLRQIENNLSVLMGRSALGGVELDDINALPTLPELPFLGVPTDLLMHNPSLQAAHLRVQQADFSVAAALADRLPNFSLSSSYRLSDDDFSLTLSDRLFSISATILQPLFDGKRRKKREQIAREAVRENLYAFTALYIETVRDVENALVAEQYSQQRLDSLLLRIKLAQETVTQSRLQYSSGQTSYLNVLNAVTALQDLEALDITYRRALLENRLALYSALGDQLIVQERL